MFNQYNKTMTTKTQKTLESYKLKKDIKKMFKKNSKFLNLVLPLKDWKKLYGIYLVDLEKVKNTINQ
jgi:hypothetical protein